MAGLVMLNIIVEGTRISYKISKTSKTCNNKSPTKYRRQVKNVTRISYKTAKKSKKLCGKIDLDAYCPAGRSKPGRRV